ncbi:hypothetical protein PLESTM_001782500 [Pleodorina starrii]|nr:hypothetical protein PLESTM_001782500 [Pleodorina starrii]
MPQPFTSAGSALFFPAEPASFATSPPALLRPLLLISDLDDTLIGGASREDNNQENDSSGIPSNSEAQQEGEASSAAACDARSRALKAALAHWRELGASARGPQCRLAINTGRTLPLFLAALEERGEVIPEPDVLVCGVGTRVYLREAAGGPMGSASGWREDVSWAEHISAEWSIGEVTAALRAAMDQLGPDCVSWRNPAENDELKLTVCVSLGALPSLVERMDNRLRTAGLRYRVVIGPTDDPPGWAYMDVLPARAGKNAAAHRVVSLLGCEAGAAVVAGDAPNDLDMLAGAHHHSIVVSNCHPSVRSFALEAASRHHQHQHQQQGQGQQGQRQRLQGGTTAIPQADGQAADSEGEGQRDCDDGDNRNDRGLAGDWRAVGGWDERAVAAAAAGCGGAAVAAELGPVMRHVLAALMRGQEVAAEEEGAGARWRGEGDGCGRLGPVELAAAAVGPGGEVLSPSLRVHLASLPAAGGVMEGLHAFGFM